jgi:hypothetical protein
MAEFQFDAGAAKFTGQHHGRARQGKYEQAAQQVQGVGKTGHTEQHATDEKTQPLQRVFRSGQKPDPFVEETVRALGHDKLDGAFRAHLGEVLGDPGQGLGTHGPGH